MTNSEPPAPRRPFQFRLSTLLWVTALWSVLCGAFAGLRQGHVGTSRLPHGFFVLMAVAAPLAIMIAVGLVLSLRRWLDRRR
jgi:hypothetical protein